MAIFSCTSIKSTTYFQDKNSIESKQYAALAFIEPIPLRIQPDDILAIIVNSLSEESDAIFNFPNVTNVITTQFPGSASTGGGPLGYPVNKEGEISLPLIGKIRVAGMTLKEADISIRERVCQYIKDPSVNIRLLNQKFTVIGEVTKPGIYNILDNSTKLTDVISIAGDMTVYGRRDNVMLIRTVNNKREVVKLDLTTRQVLNSPYYFIENNDVIYVEARPGKTATISRAIQLLPIVAGLTSVTLLFVNFIVR